MAWAAVLFISAPVAASLGIIKEYEGGAFPPEADSIDIAMFSYVFLTLLTAPLTWGLVWFCTRRYPGSLPLTFWNSHRPVWSAAWTVSAVVAALAFVVISVLAMMESHVPLAVHALADAWMLLVLRSAVVGRSVTSSPDRLEQASPVK